MKAIVIGGGIIGGAVAWRLAAGGLKVDVFERARLGMEASWAAAGMIAPQAEIEGPGPLFDIALRGREVLEALLPRLIEESGVDPERDEQGVLYVALDEAERTRLQGRARWQRAAGLALEELSGRDALKLEPALSPRVLHALFIAHNHRVENRRLCQAYVNAAARLGAIFSEGAQVDEILVRSGRASGVRFSDGSTREAEVIVNAAGAWASRIRGLESDGIRLRPVRGQIACFDVRPGLITSSLFALDGILIPRRDGRLLAGSTLEEAGYNKSVTMGGLAHILARANAIAPVLGSIPFRAAWAGLRPAAPDNLPVIGPSPTVPNVFYAAGHYRSGILLSAITGEMIAALVAGQRPDFDATPYLPARFKRTAAAEPR